MNWGIAECEICGKTFEKNSTNQRYCCKACARKANSERKRLEYQCKGKSPKPVKKRRKEKSVLSVLAAEARKKRMSYGQYIGMIEMPNRIERVWNG